MRNSRRARPWPWFAIFVMRPRVARRSVTTPMNASGTSMTPLERLADVPSISFVMTSGLPSCIS